MPKTFTPKRQPAALKNEQRIAHICLMLESLLPFNAWADKMRATKSLASDWVAVVQQVLKFAALSAEEEKIAKTALGFDAAITFAEADHVHA